MKLRVEPRLPGDLPVGALLLGAMLFIPLGGHFIDSGRFQFAECGIKASWGIPCLSCGATRATLHLLHGDIVAAFLMQPLVITIYFAAVIWGIASIWAMTQQKTFFPQMKTIEAIGVIIASVLVVLGNWLYLLKAGI